jgi:NADH-quinone oxidoreductase subunit N
MFYIAAYGVMNAGLFGVLMMLPAKPDPFAVRVPSGGADSSASTLTATTAETFEDIAGLGRKHPALGLAMAACCFSLIGLPLTVGFFGKYYLIRPALEAGWYGLVIVLVLNAAVSAGYYLRIVGAMFLRTSNGQSPATVSQGPGCDLPGGQGFMTVPLVLAVAASALGSLALGIYLPATNALSDAARRATTVDVVVPVVGASAAPDRP